MISKKTESLAIATAIGGAATFIAGLYFYHNGMDEFGGLTGVLGYMYVVMPLGLGTLLLLKVALQSQWAERKRNHGSEDQT